MESKTELSAVQKKALRNMAVVVAVCGGPKLFRLSKTNFSTWIWILKAGLAAALAPMMHHLVNFSGLQHANTAAAVVSGLPLGLLDNETRTTLACHLVATLIVRVMRRATHYWVSIIMMFSTSQLLFAWLFDPTAHPVPYQRFLENVSDFIPKGNVKILRESMQHGKPIDYSLFLTGNSLPHAVIAYLVHHVTTFSFKFYAKLYVWRVVYALLMKQPLHIQQVLRDTLRSALFLSWYGLMVVAGFCTAGHLNSFMKVTKPLLWCILAIPGLSVLLESRERQQMLPSYCLTFVLYEWINKAKLGNGALLAGLASWANLQSKPALLHALWS